MINCTVRMILHLAGFMLLITPPNIAKKLGIQHLPTTVVGESLAPELATQMAQKQLGINHLGDFGTPFGKVLLGVDTYGFDFDSSDPVGQMHDLYVRINAEAKNDEQVASAARKKFMQLEQGDPRLVALWSKLRELNMNENENCIMNLALSLMQPLEKTSPSSQRKIS